MNGQAEAALTQLRAYLATEEVEAAMRLPPERRLCDMLGVQRPALRRALALLEAEGQIWRHVGRGTFVGGRPLEGAADIAAIARRSNPAEVMQARLLLEPELARLAALHATPAQVAEMRVCLARSRAAATWRQYEAWDNRLHHAIAEATQNTPLVALLDTLNAVRRAVTWGRLRVVKERPEPDHHSFAEHDALVDAIEDRDMDRAHDGMRRHLESVERNLLGPRGNGSRA